MPAPTTELMTRGTRSPLRSPRIRRASGSCRLLWFEVDGVVRNRLRRNVLEPVRRLRGNGDHVTLRQVVGLPTLNARRTYLTRRGVLRGHESATGDKGRLAFHDDEHVVRVLVHFDVARAAAL